MGLTAQIVDLQPVGYFRIFARPPGGVREEITFFRDVPTQVTALSTTDPFGDSGATLTFPQITIWDRPGSGDLKWLVPYTDIDIVWQNTPEYHFQWSWEGFSIDESLTLDATGSSLTLECRGALLQADNYLAAPYYPQRPVPYEILIRETLSPAKRPGLRTKELKMEFPADWHTVVPVFNQPDYMWFLKPWGVTAGQQWTGLTTRSTGAWDPVLSGYVQGLLSVMFDEGGAQWTIRKDIGRKPAMYLRKPPLKSDPNMLVVDLGTPGVEITLSRDFTQSANVIYGQGTDAAGVAFSGMEINNLGDQTYFTPFSAARTVYPTSSNPNYNSNITRKETLLRFPDGMDELAARQLSNAQLMRFADPGYTGSISLKVDPILNTGVTFPRLLIQAGRSILVRGIRGDSSGVQFHITECSINVGEGAVQLTIDSKYRDQLTVDEVRARTRDALTPLRSLQTGKYSNTVQDLLKPWSYADGSGMIPEGSKEFFTKKIPDTAAFPWTDWTVQFPPKNPAYSKYYIKIPKADLANAANNWSGDTANGIFKAAIAVKMAQSGTIRLSQIAAYDRDGHLLPVHFHASVYNNSGVSPRDMPRIPTGTVKIVKPATATYPAGQPQPFFEGAWEKIKPNGAETSDPGVLFPESAGFVMGWGNYYELAGYSPGLASRGAPKTGKLEDEQPWSFDTSSMPGFDKYNPANNVNNAGAGVMYVMIYCDAQALQDVYFLGRFFRQEPGTS